MLFAGLSASEADARGLTLGFDDYGYMASDRAGQALWFQRTKDVGGQIVRLNAPWSSIAPAKRPNGFKASDPASSGYDWRTLDAAVNDARARGLKILITIYAAPRWAEGPRRPRSALPGTWKPQPSALAAFAKATARRYAGRVHYWQVWNEPNIDWFLAPQWTRSRGRLAPASPAMYRRLLNASYRALKAVDPSNVVVAAGNAPFGDPRPGGRRIQPALFVRKLLCLSGRRLRLAHCPDPAHFDVLDHHPYAIRGPRSHALNADDVTVPDIGRLTRPLRVAERTGRVLPRRAKRVWVTEMSWDSSPPDPWGVPERTQALWLEDALRVLWRQGVDTVTWFNVIDQAPVPSYFVSNQSGVYERNGVKKASWTAFRFPFVVTRYGRGAVSLWLRAPTTGRVTIERLRGGHWRPFVRFHARATQVVTRHARPGRASAFRARINGLVSLPWRLSTR